MVCTIHFKLNGILQFNFCGFLSVTFSQLQLFINSPVFLYYICLYFRRRLLVYSYCGQMDKRQFLFSRMQFSLIAAYLLFKTDL